MRRDEPNNTESYRCWQTATLTGTHQHETEEDLDTLCDGTDPDDLDKYRYYASDS